MFGRTIYVPAFLTGEKCIFFKCASNWDVGRSYKVVMGHWLGIDKFTESGPDCRFPYFCFSNFTDALWKIARISWPWLLLRR